MKIINSLIKFGFALTCVILAVSCTKTDQIDNRETDYGYVQLRLFKKDVTRASDELEYLRDAAKIKATFIYENQEISQAVNLNSSDNESAEFGLRSDKLKLLVGKYTFIGFKIYDKVGTLIQEGEPESPELIEITTGAMTQHSVDLNVKPRGKVMFQLSKDLGHITLSSRASTERPREYAFAEIKTFSVKLKNEATPSLEYSFTNLKAAIKKGESGLYADTLLSITAGSYVISECSVMGENKEILEVITNFENAEKIVIKDNATTNAKVPVRLQETDEYIKDYIALKKIWETLDGPSWGWMGDGLPAGANWNFDKDVDLWGNQPGVVLFNNGRVASVNLGSFNAKGDIPAELGQLTELTELWLGSHNDVEAWQGEEATAGTVYKEYSGRFKGGNISEIRRQHARKLFASKYETEPSAILRSVLTFKGKPYVAPKKYATSSAGEYTNGITSIPDEISKLTKLETLFIANGKVSTLPDLSTLKSLTDLEIYNCPLMTEFPTSIAQIPTLVAVNLGQNPQWNSQECDAGLNALFSGAGQGELQILYFDHNKLTVLPESCKNLKKLAFIDVSTNKITKINPFTKNVKLIQGIFNDNKITEIPADFCDIRDGETINFTRNMLTKMPNIFTSKEEYVLGSLNLSQNKITEIEGNADDTYNGINVGTLILNGNKLTGGFPKCFAKTSSQITNIEISNNLLDSIPGEALKGLFGLISFNLSGNRLTKVPFEFNGRELPYLFGLDLSYNNFVKFPTMPLDISTLTSFFISSQIGANGEKTLREWPNGIQKHKGLRVFQIQGNDIRKVDAFPDIMNYLDISDNPNISIAVPAHICTRIAEGTFKLVYDKSQLITGCSILDIGGK